MGRGFGRDAKSDYGDTPPRNSKLGAFFGSLYTLFAVLTIAAGVALNATGAWAIANQSDAGYGSLDCSGSVLAANVYIGIISVCAGAGLIVLAIMGILAVGQGCCSLFSAIIYVLAMNVLVAAMTFSATVLLTISEGGIDYADTRSFFSDVWATTVSSAPLSACDVEREFQCRGCFDDQCAGCDSTAIADGSCTSGQLQLHDSPVRQAQVVAVDAWAAARGRLAAAMTPTILRAAHGDTRLFPAVLLGDFNAEAGSTELRFLRGHATIGGVATAWTDAWEAAQRSAPAVAAAAAGETYVPSVNPAATLETEPDRRLDYCWVAPPAPDGRGAVLRCRVVFDHPDVDGVYPSDHYGVVADLRADAVQGLADERRRLGRSHAFPHPGVGGR
ncbi:hypothetical protein I4F81_010781 [Pyropia yezoensis]|uniref:Uncharacterized protein n=1 Tax=Pyropia yezoensis TaxID=2788 RepID=A0ACC3CDN8_PYRYE|nr:hypothetical protein I4F81_010781 [Neopyropia yezoensis]